jgi:hypothetical protein
MACHKLSKNLRNGVVANLVPVVYDGAPLANDGVVKQ